MRGREALAASTAGKCAPNRPIPLRFSEAERGFRAMRNYMS